MPDNHQPKKRKQYVKPLLISGGGLAGLGLGAQPLGKTVREAGSDALKAFFREVNAVVANPNTPVDAFATTQKINQFLSLLGAHGKNMALGAGAGAGLVGLGALTHSLLKRRKHKRAVNKSLVKSAYSSRGPLGGAMHGLAIGGAGYLGGKLGNKYLGNALGRLTKSSTAGSILGHLIGSQLAGHSVRLLTKSKGERYKPVSTSITAALPYITPTVSDAMRRAGGAIAKDLKPKIEEILREYTNSRRNTKTSLRG